jgi:hypothetical protein
MSDLAGNWFANNGEYADDAARSDWLAERPDPDYDYFDDGTCPNCGLELRRNRQTGRCKVCGDQSPFGGVA